MWWKNEINFTNKSSLSHVLHLDQCTCDWVAHTDIQFRRKYSVFPTAPRFVFLRMATATTSNLVQPFIRRCEKFTAFHCVEFEEFSRIAGKKTFKKSTQPTDDRMAAEKKITNNNKSGKNSPFAERNPNAVRDCAIEPAAAAAHTATFLRSTIMRARPRQMDTAGQRRERERGEYGTVVLVACMRVSVWARRSVKC